MYNSQMAIFNVLKYKKIVTLAADGSDKTVTLTALEHTFLLNLLSNVPFTDKAGTYALWSEKEVMTVAELDESTTLIDGLIHKLIEP
jgi:hypothetical protein